MYFHKPIRFMFLLTLISGNAFYLLGGMLFRKTAWLKTTLAVIVISIALFSMFVGYAYVVYGYTNYVVYMPEWMQESLVQHNTADSTDMRLLLFCL